MNGDLSLNMRLIGHNRCGDFGGFGEGTAMQKSRDGRRILWLAHTNAPKDFTAVDVTDPTKPKVILQTDLPHQKMRSNSLEVQGDLMAVARQCNEKGEKPSGVELFDISVPEKPKSISFFDCSGPHSRGVHTVWLADPGYMHISSGAADFTPSFTKDDQFYRIIDIHDVTKPHEIGRWWMPGTREGEAGGPLPRLPKYNNGNRAHNANVYPQRPDRCYLGYFDSGIVILDISDRSSPKVISQWNPHPPYNGMSHTVLPLFSRDLLVVADEAFQDGGVDWPKLTWVLDARREENPVPISTLPLPPLEGFGDRGGRFGSHNLHENMPNDISFQSDTIIIGAFFNAGVRVYDLSDPLQPKNIAYYVPPPPEGSRAGTIQINDVYADENGIIYAVDRLIGGLYIFEMDI